MVDQGSANGTYVNSLKVAEQALKNNQELRFGAMAFRVDLHEDPEATVATPFLADDSATVMAPATPPPRRPARGPAARCRSPRRRRRCPQRRAAAAAERRRREGALPAARPRPRRRPPVPQMAGGAAAREEGQEPALLGRDRLLRLPAARGALAGVIGGGVFMATKGAADAAHAWLGHVRQGQTDGVAAGMTEAYRTRPTAEEVEASPPRSPSRRTRRFLSRSVDNDRATLTGVLTGGGRRRSRS